MKNLFKNLLITALLAAVVFLLMKGNHGAIFLPFLITIIGTLYSYGSFEAARETSED